MLTSAKPLVPLDKRKFKDPITTLTGEARAQVALRQLEVVWFNTGTLCNIACANCYIESGPRNDRFVYLTLADMEPFLCEIRHKRYPVKELGFTGGEPFMNPEFLDLLAAGLAAGYDCLVLTNAMRPMQRPKYQDGLLQLHKRYGPKLKLRVSLDHYTKAHHETERGPNSWDSTLAGIDWLKQNNISFSIAGRQCWGESDAQARQGYARLFTQRQWDIDATQDHLILFPEMETKSDIAEITTTCWEKLGVAPDSPMCANARMVVKRKGAKAPSVLACTLLPYDRRFELGETLAQALGHVALNHPHCARFCVLGGANCSG